MSDPNEVYDLGIDAFNDGKSERDNPYVRGTQEFIEWRSGWQNAEQDAGEGEEEEEEE